MPAGRHVGMLACRHFHQITHNMENGSHIGVDDVEVVIDETNIYL